MEIISKIFAGLMIAIIFGVLLIVVIEFALRIYNYILDWQIKKRKRENALLALENLKLSYDILMLCRKRYYETKYIENSEERVAKQEKLKAIYEEKLELLSNPDYVSDKEFLTDEERAELEEILSRPRYGLF